MLERYEQKAANFSALLTAIDGDTNSVRRSDWFERDAALVLMAVLADLQADELIPGNGATSVPPMLVAS